MGLDIRVMTLEAKERSGFAHRAVAGVGLVGLVVPCMIWLAVSHLSRRLQPLVRRPA